MVWLDVLNVHAHIHMGTFSFEPGPPHDVPPPVALETVHYPFAEAKRAVDASAPQSDGTRRLRYINPQTGGPVMPLLDCYLVRLEPGQTTIPARTSAHSVWAVVEGTGSTTAGTGTIAWKPRDVFTLPHGAAVTHTAAETSYLFVCTDREIMRRLDLLKETVGT
jgi:gentisate 1,2-dioxygenase